ncbi:MAG TPA: nuclear transport factor 2 family protein [Thermoleophilaceae bacterium]
MPRDLLEQARTGYELFARGAYDEAFEVFDPEIEWVEWQALPGATVRHGHDEVRAYLEEIRESFAEIHYDLEDAELDEPYVIAQIHVHGIGRMSGLPVSARVVHVWRTGSDGRAVQLRVFGSMEEAREALASR